MKPLPTIVSSLSGEDVLNVTEFDGADRVPNRDALAFYFRSFNSAKEKVRFGVMFSGSVLAVRPDTFGLPTTEDRDENFKSFSLAALGDHLETKGELPPTPPSTSAHLLECFSPHFQEWADREALTDALLERYIGIHLYEAWTRDQLTWTFGIADAVRVGRTTASVNRIIDLGAGDNWEVVALTSDGIELKPLGKLIRSRQIGEGKSILSTTHPVDSEQPPKVMEQPATFVYVDETRLADLKRLRQTDFDLRKLVALCEELNICYRSQCYHAVAALTRALIDHVPPIFNFSTFAQLASNYSAGRSLKAALQRLQTSARNIADMHLHQPVRKNESLPTRTQVNFSNDVDLLLAEIVRALEEKA